MNLKTILGNLKLSNNNKAIFSNIYRKRSWRGTESHSGKGSDAVQTRVLCHQLSILLRDLQVQSILDLPCGDFNWIHEVVSTNNLDYIGGDIVDELVDEDNRLYRSASVRFEKIDLVKDALPSADILFCRDCLVHLSNDAVSSALTNIKNGSFKYVAMTSFVNRVRNSDIRTGKWRPLNMTVPPFSLPQPIAVINENCTEENGRFSDKTVSVWRFADLFN